MANVLTLRKLAATAGLDITALDVSRNHDGSVGASVWTRTDESGALASLKSECVAAGLVVVAETAVGFAVCAPASRDSVRSANWANQRPRWRG